MKKIGDGWANRCESTTDGKAEAMSDENEAAEAGATDGAGVDGNLALRVEAEPVAEAAVPKMNAGRTIEFLATDRCVRERLGLGADSAPAGEVMARVRGFDVDHKRYKSLLYLGVWALLRGADQGESRAIHAELRDAGVIPEREDIYYMRQLAGAAREQAAWEEESGTTLHHVPLTFFKDWLGFSRNAGCVNTDREGHSKAYCLECIKREVIAGRANPVPYLRERIREFQLLTTIARSAPPTGEFASLTDWVTAINDDCMSPRVPIADEAFDVLIGDPPYGTEFERASRIRSGVPGYGNGAEFSVLCGAWVREWARWLVPGGLVMAFQASKRADILATALREAGFEIMEPLIWDTGYPHNPGGSARLADLGAAEAPLSNVEIIVMARKPKTKKYKKATRRDAEEKGIDRGFKKLTEDDKERWLAKGLEIQVHANGALGTMVGCDRPNGGGHGGGALMAKPVALIEFLMDWSNVGMGPMIDPFMGGSGASLIAAIKAGKNLRAYERDNERYTAAVASARAAFPADPWAEDEN